MTPALYRYTIPYAGVDWDTNNTPRSLTHDDCYYSKENGLAESEYVFLSLNEITERWKSGGSFVIAELGFGTGLNFLLTLKKWKESKRPGRLTFISFEKSPLRPSDMERAHSHFPQIKDESEALTKKMTLLHSGINCLSFDSLQVRLLLVIGDAQSTLASMHFEANAWYLDGFAPAKNASLWSDELFSEIRSHSAPDCTASTFSAARQVKDALTKNGFSVEKVSGYGNKRDSIRATLLPTSTRNKESTKPINTAAIIGAGIAGTSVAYSLSLRGVTAHLFESGADVGTGASGNPVGMAKPDFSAVPDTRSEISHAGFAYLKRLCEQLPLPAATYRFDGIYRDAMYGRLENFLKRFDELAPDPEWVQQLSSEEATVLNGGNPTPAGLLYPHAGCIRPAALCKELASVATLSCNSCIVRTEYGEDGWWLQDSKDKSHGPFDTLILANSFEAQKLLRESLPEMTYNHGQLLAFQEAGWPNPNVPLIGPGYYITADDKQYIGATYEHNDCASEQVEKRKALCDSMASFLQLPELLSPSEFTSRRSVRCNTADRLPITGSWSGFDEFTTGASVHLPDANLAKPQLLLAFGSKGLTFAPLLAEVLVSGLCKEPVPLFKHCLKAVDFVRLYQRRRVRS